MKLYQPQTIAPSYEEVAFDDCTINAIRIELSPEEYTIAEDAAQNMWANKKRGNYGGGLVNTNTDPFKVERTGRLGEIAFSKIASIPIDLSYIEGGDDYDFKIQDKLCDIKTRCQRYANQVGLIYAFTESGKEIPLTADIYIFAFLENENLTKKTTTVYLVGYCTQEMLKTWGIKKARRGSHFNYEAPFKDLLPLDKLI